MSNAYVTLSTLKGTAALNFTGTAYDTRLLTLIENVSREVDAHCRRFFYVVTETRTFDGPSGTRLNIPDLIAVGTLTEDTNQDGTFETTWAAADFHLWPYNAAPTAEWGRGYMALLVNPKSNGTQDEFLKGRQMYQIAGTWGWREYVEDTGERGSGTFAASGTALTLTTASTLSVGQTIKIDSEYIYITATGTAGTTTGTAIVNVKRAVNGSTAAAHSTGTLFNFVYPGEIQEAVLIQTSRLLKRRESGFASQVGFPETGQLIVFKGGLDADIKDLIARYVRMEM